MSRRTVLGVLAASAVVTACDPSDIIPTDVTTPTGGGGGDVVLPIKDPGTTTTIAPSSTTAPPTTVAPPTTATPSTTAAPPTTAAPSTTAAPPTTATPSTTVAPPTTTPTTATPSTTAAPPTTATPSTTAAPTTTPPTTAAPTTTAPSSTAPATTQPPVSSALSAETAVTKLTFGPTPGMITSVAAMGPAAFIEDQLRRSAPDPEIEQQVLTIEPIHMSPKELNDNRIRNWWMPNYTGHVTLYRAARSSHQLYEMMCLLWMDHFNVFQVDYGHYLTPDYQENVIRRHAMGSFAELLKATAHAPAMLHYLNNDVSDASSPDGINENYGRELLELHSLGIDRNNRQIYDQQDVENASMVMGGWSTEMNRNRDNFGQFVYRPEFEYGGPDLTMIGGTWSTAGLSGKARGDSLLDFLARHPTTAHHIAYKICRRFVSDEPSDALIESTAQVFIANDTAIVPTLRHVFTSAEFAASGGRKFRRPIEFQAALLRATNTTFSSVGEHMTFRRLSGYFLQPARNHPWAWEQPDGYPDRAEHWAVADALAQRWNHAIQVAEGRVGETTTDLEPLLSAAGGDTAGAIAQGIASELGLGVLPANVVEANLQAIGYAPDRPAADVDRRRLGTLTGLLCSHPNFQIR
ncbi:MAG: DUF1800 domain-containing protein [Actinomycetota bacterium]